MLVIFINTLTVGKGVIATPSYFSSQKAVDMKTFLYSFSSQLKNTCPNQKIISCAIFSPSVEEAYFNKKQCNVPKFWFLIYLTLFEVNN